MTELLPSIRARSAIVALLFIAVVFFGLTEIGVRIYTHFALFYDVEMTRYANTVKLASANPRLGHIHRPLAAAVLMGVPVRINSIGLRDQEYPLARTASTTRIAFLGDSLTFGWGVPEEESFATRLERKMSARRKTEIMNFGVGNYNTDQEVALFLEKGLAYHPDKVVLFYFINDAEPTPQKSSWAFLSQSRALTFFWSRAKTLGSRLWPGQGYAAYYSGLYADGQPGWQVTRRALLELRDACVKSQMELGVVLLPELHQLDPYPFAEQHQKLMSFLAANQVDAIDLAPLMRNERDPETLWVALDDAHPNARAHAKIAQLVESFVAKGLP
jgi:lysophospholipase L1-like esterase